MAKKKIFLGRCNSCWGPLDESHCLELYYGSFCSDDCLSYGPKMIQPGDNVKVFLDEKIAKAKSGKKKDWICPGVLELWEDINGHIGIIIKIVSDDEIWVKGNRTQKERMFNKDTLIRYES